MNWIVGLDLRSPDDGALRLAAWLARSCRPAGGERFLGVHVLEEGWLRPFLEQESAEGLMQAARRSANDLVARAGAAGAITDVKVVQSVRVDDGLEAALLEEGGEALVVCRRARRRDRSLVRLGAVARRLLRNLPAPVVVVPPDLADADLGDGPVLALTALSGDSVAACRFGADLARRTGRPLAVAHVVEEAPGSGADFLPRGPREDLGRALREEGERALPAWLSASGIEAESALVLQGSAVEEAVELALRLRSPLVVAGSRALSAAGRAVLPSFSSELAAAAPLPVAVVPPRA